MPTTSLRQPAAPGVLPRELPFDNTEWVFEPKYDGIRGILHSTAAGCELRSRRRLELDRSRELCSRIAAVLGGREAILDGEIVALDRQGRPVLRDLLRGGGYIAFAAFDLLHLDGRDLSPLSLAERKRQLARLVPADTGPLYKVLTVDECGRALFEAIRKMQLEGIVAKRKCDPYTEATTWYTIANPAYAPGDTRERARRRVTALPRSPAPGAGRSW